MTQGVWRQKKGGDVHDDVKLLRGRIVEPDPTQLSREELRSYLRSVSTVSLWPFCGKALGLSRSATYTCEQIKCLRLGHLRKVSSVWLEEFVFGEERGGDAD